MTNNPCQKKQPQVKKPPEEFEEWCQVFGPILSEWLETELIGLIETTKTNRCPKKGSKIRVVH